MLAMDRLRMIRSSTMLCNVMQCLPLVVNTVEGIWIAVNASKSDIECEAVVPQNVLHFRFVRCSQHHNTVHPMCCLGL